MIHRRRAPVRILDIHLSDGQVAFYHIERVVTQQPLECIWVSPIPQILDCTRVSKAMDGDIGNACPRADRLHQIQQPVTIEWPAGLDKKEWLPHVGIWPKSQVSPEGLMCAW